MLFGGPYALALDDNWSYDVSLDGQRFLMLKPVGDPGAVPTNLVVVEHFDEELKRLVPTQ
jgi:hypothetical protein